jgi:hypothetical protein
MDIKIKKALAKEVIYLFSILSILILIWGTREIYSLYIDKKISKINLNIEILELKSNILETQLDSIKFVPPPPPGFLPLDEYGIPIKKPWNKIIETKTREISNDLKSNDLLLDTEEAKLFSIKETILFKHKNSIFFWLLIISFSLLYPVRLIFKIVKWATTVLNEKENE